MPLVSRLCGDSGCSVSVVVDKKHIYGLFGQLADDALQSAAVTDIERCALSGKYLFECGGDLLFVTGIFVFVQRNLHHLDEKSDKLFSEENLLSSSIPASVYALTFSAVSSWQQSANQSRISSGVWL